ncbi:lipopolysaccharide export system protein LptA [Roseovarius marisflavi]|uniref:Lipopolysaccharide export system protein LptA n=1 Tax=Roseovarius marisflavi TaxID=1054996 RepID=A0A1M6XUM0_9RHOB|nr:lipopolysaccharide transport periplasmic protein LptA [Roseovarius marisflavi]SHL09720.1 lipopolysaccharide export system protein LptA [Roseovarius marisflavi]
MTYVPRIMIFVTGLFLMCLPAIAAAQGALVAFGSTQRDRDLPVEVTSETLNVNQNDNTAVFTGNVVIGQGEMRLSAPRVLVVYLEDQSGIESLEATGGVTVVSGPDAAEAARAEYNIVTGMIRMQGDVLLVQGDNAITGDTLIVDTTAGTAQVSGRVKTLLQPEGKP